MEKKVLGISDFNMIELFCKKGFFCFISETLANYRKGEVALVATGPLTNVARLILKILIQYIHYQKFASWEGHMGLQAKFMAILQSLPNSTFTATQKLNPDSDGSCLFGSNRVNIVGLDVTDKYLRIDEGFISRLSSRQCKRRTREHGDNSEEMRYCKIFTELSIDKIWEI